MVIVAVMELLYTHLSTMARTLHTLSENYLANLLASQNGEQSIDPKPPTTSLGLVESLVGGSDNTVVRLT